MGTESLKLQISIEGLTGVIHAIFDARAKHVSVVNFVFFQVYDVVCLGLLALRPQAPV